MPNDNVLAGIRCHKCGSEGPFNVWGNALFLSVTDDGVSDFSDFSIDSDSIFICLNCKYNGFAREFDSTRRPHGP